jgi:DNA-binding beta-propeller fold protein YncE
MGRRRLLGLLGWTCVLASALLVFSTAVFHAAPQMGAGAGGYRVLRTIPLGGDGSWDYITIDPDAHLIYSPRTENIQILDLNTGKLAGTITGMKGLHGIAIAPEFNRGVATGADPDAVAYLIDLKAMKVTDKITFTGAKGSDSLMYDPFTKRFFVNTAGSNNAQVIDAATGKYVGSVTLPGRPEAAVSDGKGSMFVNIVDKDQVVEYDAQKMTVKNTYSSTPCVRGYGIAMDRTTRRLFIGCQPTGSSGVVVVMNADNGKVIASIPIGVGGDGMAFDPATGDIFAPCRDDGSGKTGATYIFHEDTPDKYSNVAVVHTIYGARTGDEVDPKTHRFYSHAAAENTPPPNAQPTADNPHPRLVPVPASFSVVEIGK